MQSGFIGILLFFWLTALHSLSVTNLINVDERKFYIPKFVICFALQLSICTSLLYTNYNTYYDPTYAWKDQTFTAFLLGMIFVLSIVYLGYFLVISYMTYTAVRRMKKNYRIVFYYTFTVAICSVVALAFHGYGGYGDRNLVFMAIFALFNIYVINMSFLYAPTWEGFMKMQLEQEKEHREENNSILDNFYKETELSEIQSRRTDDESLEEEKHFSKMQSAQPRHFKKDPN